MIDAALGFLTAKLNAHLQGATRSTSTGAELSRLVNDAGDCVLGSDRLGIALLSVAEVPSAGAHGTQTPWTLDIRVIVASNHYSYEMALRQLSQALEFFRDQPVFTSGSHPELDARLDSVRVTALALSLDELGNVWTMIGGKLLPSIPYDVRVTAAAAGSPAPGSA